MLKPVLRFCKNYIRKLILHLLRFLPISSEKLGAPKGFYKSTRDWIVSSNASKLPKIYKEIYPSHWIHPLEPKTIEKSPDWRFSAGSLGGKFKTPSTFVALIPNGRVCGSSGAVISPDDKLLADVSLEFGVIPENANAHSILKKIKLPKVSEINDIVAVLSVVGGTTYFHWMFDVLPRIHLLRCSGMINDIDKFLLNKICFDFQEETLNILEISKNKIITTDENFHVKADKLVVPSLPGITGIMPQWVCNFLRKEFLRSRDIGKADRAERIYISRSNSNYRRIINENELIEFLAKLHFKAYIMENLSVIEQASIFSSAEVVVAPHGGGLTNIVFCSPESKIIELFSPNYVNPCYRGLSNLGSLEYWYLLGEGQPPSKHKGDHLMNAVGEDMRININLLAKVIELASIES